MTSVPRVFLDACVLIAAAASPEGGSALVMGLCERRVVQAVASQRILQEAENNIRWKFQPEVLLRFYHDITAAHFRLVDAPSSEEIDRASSIIEPKDAHVLAAAIRSGASFLLTLDRKHFMTSRLRQASLDFAIQTPGDFLQQWRS